MADRRFIETEALLRAMRDVEKGSGAVELKPYLEEHFNNYELRTLNRAARWLVECTDQIRLERARSG